MSLPEEFSKIIKDFISDLQTTFPEMNPLIKKWWKDRSVFDYILEEEEREKKDEKVEREREAGADKEKKEKPRTTRRR